MVGMNLGVVSHASQMQWGNDGEMPQYFVERLKEVLPERLRLSARMTGTQSNTMSRFAVGYDDTVLEAQIKNQRRRPPQSSYWNSFLKMYHQFGWESVAITINSHTHAHEAVELIEWLLKYDVKINGIELSNEDYLYPSFTGMQGGSPTIWERLSFGLNESRMRNDRKVKMQNRRDQLADVAKDLHQFKIPIGVPFGNPSLYRDGLWNEVMLEQRFYDYACLHIYTVDASDNGIYNLVRSHIAPLPKDLEKRVTEFQWNYRERPKGHARTDEEVLRAFEKAFKDYGVKSYYWHCLWNRFHANGWARGVEV